MTRLAWLLLASSALAVLVTARLLTPAPAGHGTHLALGLPPCGFLAWTGLPCPTCGLTTAFAWLARGELSAAMHANPMGVPLFLGCLALPLVALHGLARNQSVLATIERTRADHAAIVLTLGLLATWLAKLASTL